MFFYFIIFFCLKQSIFATVNSDDEVYVSEILAQMKHYGACEDFYDFACGSGKVVKPKQNKEFITKLYTANDTTEKYIKDVKRFYESCNEYNEFDYKLHLKEVKNLVDDVWEKDQNSNLTAFFAKLILRQSLPIFDIGLNVDENSENLQLELGLPKYVINNWGFLSDFKDGCLKKYRLRFFERSINMIEVYDLYRNCTEDFTGYFKQVTADVNELLYSSGNNKVFSPNDELISLLKLIPRSTSNMDSFELKTIDELQQLYPVVNWEMLLELLTERDLLPSHKVQVYFKDYLKNMFTLLGKIDKKLPKGLKITFILRKIIDFFGVLYSYNLYNHIVLKKFETSDYCSTMTTVLFPDIVSYLNDRDIDQHKKDIVTEVFAELREKFCASIEDNEFSEFNSSKTNIRCNSIKLQMFSALEYSTLVESYTRLNISSNYQQNLISSLINLRRNVYKFSSVSQPTPGVLFSYLINPLVENIPYFQNSVFASWTLLKNVKPGLTKFLSIANTGVDLALQITRIFSPSRLEVKDIELIGKDIDTEYSYFLKTMKTILDHVSHQTIQGKHLQIQINGSLSLNDRVSENAAFRLLTDTLKIQESDPPLPFISSIYSKEETFFVALVQNFCEKPSFEEFMLKVFEDGTLPNAVRVKNMAGTSQEFFDIFHCPAGSEMDLRMRIQFPFLPTDEEEILDADPN